ncbi:hypothetical protein GOZ96_22120 [Agrobacterium vitis]|uniref:Proline racemase n=1 Tax=Agrobacterium vitis TaxID=373 RepID=A0A368NP08_AGRVI|nr:proline racemase family protein [Agrobacterium vitis]KAA3506480.1 hypothetical protein DXM22_23335 [Agrobacterium vitis]KAA3520949.1 hypothetical protein DXT89_23910 [Agrobacterium vitis]MCF1479828.1 hypothetical protein [Agrobacterium vitis]MUZ99272.1 hypothetical protein [Agrobacterium vitis]MVA32808.1 hypothetical protein [Agrobacterium vitis]
MSHHAVEIAVVAGIEDGGSVEIGDVIVGGVSPPPGDTLWEQSRFIASDDTLRNFVLNVASFATRIAAALEVEGLGTMTVDTAYGGDSFVIVDAVGLGFSLKPDEARELAELGMRITAAANEQLGFVHPCNADWNHISFCQMTTPATRENGILTGKSAVAIRPGKIDRSPTGTGCSARLAVMHARGEIGIGETYIGRSIIDSEFKCHIDSLTEIGGLSAIRPVISGRAWITGVSQLMLDPTDPWPSGYRLSDTWPAF